MITIKKQVLISLYYFLIAAFLGVLLRLFPVASVNATYKYIVHTHSHIALLGWIYIALTSLLFHLFIKKEALKKYKLIFWVTQITILGMLLSFPLTGYALFSIVFSTLFLFCSYWFYIFFKRNNNCNKTSYYYKFIYSSLLFMVFSCIGPWALGIIMNTLGNTSHWYKNAIYFYLHFQYNGWFIFCLLGLFFFFLEKNRITISKNKMKHFYILMILSCLSTLCLSFLWFKPSKYIYIIAIMGSALQIIAIFNFQQIVSPFKSKLRQIFSPFFYKILQFVYFLFVAKIILQFITSIPSFAELASQIKDFVIGYLHLIFLGLVSLCLFVFLNHLKLLITSKLSIKLYLFGFIFSEVLIFYKGLCNWQQFSLFDKYYLILVIASSLIPLAILIIIMQNTSIKR